MRDVREIIPECSRLIREVADGLEQARRDSRKDPEVIDLILGCEVITMDHITQALDQSAEALAKGVLHIKGYD